MINSFENNPESNILPFFFIIDGENPKRDEILNIVNNSTIKNKYTITRKTNLGCGINLIDARRFIFDWCNFKKAIIFEDDLVISPCYIKFILNLHNWAKNFKNIGIVQGWNKCKFSIEEKRNLLNKVYEPISDCNIDFWGYCLDKDTWDKIKDVLYDYENLFLKNKAYLFRDHDSIRKWIRHKLNEKPNFINVNSKCDNSLFLKESFPTGQDAITLLSLYLNNLIRISTVVNRAIYIGKEGIHYFPDLWLSKEHDKVIPDWFPEDNSIVNFEY